MILTSEGAEDDLRDKPTLSAPGRHHTGSVAYLTIRIKDTEGYEFKTLDSERITLGRSSTNDVSLQADAVSRIHCTLYKQDGSWWVEDLGSSNGTRYQGTKIDGPQRLAEKDVIKCGMARLTFHLGSPPDPQGPRSGSDMVPALHQAGPEDPPEALRCTLCGAWISIAHRLPGDHMHCPRCEHALIVPQILMAKDVPEVATEDDGPRLK